MFKVDTIEQYKVLDFIKENFIISAIQLELLDNCSIKVIDGNGDSIIFTCENGKILEK